LTTKESLHHLVDELPENQAELARVLLDDLRDAADPDGVPISDTFTLWNLQGALRMANPAVPVAQTYAEPLHFAAAEYWIEPVSGQPDTYRRTRHHPNITRNRSNLMRAELQALKDKLISVLSGGDWFD
jgi:hypothetical protein